MDLEIAGAAPILDMVRPTIVMVMATLMAMDQIIMELLLLSTITLIVVTQQYIAKEQTEAAIPII